MQNHAELPRKLGLFDSTSIVIGTMVGSAIFLVPNSIAQNLPSIPMILSMWVIAGALSFLAARSGGIAVVAVGFSIYLSYFVPMSPLASKLTASGLILLLTAVNYRGIRVGATVQNLFTSLKVLGLALLIGGAFLAPAHNVAPSPAPAFSLSQFGVAMIAGLWAYNG